MLPDSNTSSLRYGVDLDKDCFLDIGMNVQIYMSLFNTFICHPFPLFILLKKSPTMNSTIRRGYIAMHVSFIVYEIIFFFFIRIYAITPYPGLYCEGPICQSGLSKSVVLAIISFMIVQLQHPFAFLMVSMHQMFMSYNSRFKLSTRRAMKHVFWFQSPFYRMKYFMTAVQFALMYLNVVGFVVLGGAEPENIDELLEEPELAFLADRGRLLLFGSPGAPGKFAYELAFFYFTLVINFSVLCFFFIHSMVGLKKITETAMSEQTQILTRKMYEVFFWQLNGSVFNHVIPLTSLMIFMFMDTSCFPPVALAVAKLVLLVQNFYYSKILFTLNSTQFCAIFIFKNSVNRKMLMDCIISSIRFLTNSKVAPSESAPKVSIRDLSLSTTFT